LYPQFALSHAEHGRLHAERSADDVARVHAEDAEDLGARLKIHLLAGLTTALLAAALLLRHRSAPAAAAAE
jgi:hypothetical protein